MVKKFPNLKSLKREQSVKLYSAFLHNVKTKSVYFPKDPLYTPKCANVSDKNISIGLYSQEFSNDIVWLEEVINALPRNMIINSWSKHHANKSRVDLSFPGINLILTLICDQPVYALTNPIQFQIPD